MGLEGWWGGFFWKRFLEIRWKTSTSAQYRLSSRIGAYSWKRRLHNSSFVGEYQYITVLEREEACLIHWVSAVVKLAVSLSRKQRAQQSMK
jgi:hypothetical protein